MVARMPTRVLGPLLVSVVLSLVGCSSGDDDAAEVDAMPPPPHFEGPIAYVATHYDVALDLSTRASTVAVTLHTTSEGDCVTIPMRPAAKSVALGGQPAARVTSVDGKLTACDGLGRGFEAGVDVVLTVALVEPLATQGNMDVGYSVQTDAAGGTFTYLVSWLNGCDRHGPCDSRPDAFATYRFQVTHPAGTQVLCPGVVSALQPTLTECRFDAPGGPSYSTFGLMARKPAWTESSLGDWGGVRATLYDRPGSMIATRLDGAQLGGELAWLVDKFGPFAYGNEIRFVAAPTYWAGFEHPGNIALGDWLGTSTSAYADGLQHTAMHEIVHQWAGDQATLAGTYDFVWKEAMAEYLTFVYEDEHLPAGVAAKTRAYWKKASANARFYPVPEDQPRPELATYYGDAYGPGPMVLFRQLEVMYGRDKVMAALVALVGTGQPRTLSVADVQAALESATGADLQKYFEAWVYGMGAPRYPVVTASFEETDAGSGSWRVRVATTSADGVARGCAFHVRLLGAGGAAAGESADYAFSNGPDGGEYDTPPPQALAFVPTTLVVDPDQECLVYTPAALAESLADPPPRMW
jgi:aminopeptidase N